ncbi:MAG: prenyltransferase/squalene oxidase repeat-containing protein, partial [Candidatus Bathyarchaeia archaeon]
MGSKRNEILGLTLIYLIIGLYSNEFTALVQAESESTAKIDSRLLSLIGQYASDYYNPEWDLTLDQYRAWIATIAWGEGGKGGYTAHSQYGKYKEAKLDGDRFDHVVIGDRFRFSTGIGPFQLDRLQETAFWPTIKKLNPKEALLYVLNWHYTNKGKGANLASFSDNSPWLAVRPGRVESCWKEVTGSEWDDHKSGKNEKLAWTDVVNRIRMDEPEYLFENNVRYIGKVRWMVNFITETDKKVSFNRYYDTFSITARTWDGVPLFSYYYAYDRSAGCEVWVLDNSGEENEFRYIFVREYVTGPLPEHRTHEGAYWIGDRYIALAGETTLTEPALDLSDKQCPSISDGLHWLRREQNLDGSWTYSGRITEENVGLTSIAVLSFLNWGLDETDFNVLQAINWILEQQKIDGSITTGTYEVYDTSLAILALVATRKSKYYSNITSATNFLISIQNDEDTGYSQLSKYYGGWPYWKGMSDWADLSNSQFVMLALWYAEQFNPTDTIVPAEVWNKAEIFVTRCQNRKESNPDYSFYNDGGFIYQPSSTIWAGGQSYASMTAAGLWGLFTCGVNKEDGRIRDAWKWLENNYHIDQNYPMGNLFLYYYLYGLSKACLLWGVNSIAGHDWYQEMTEFLINNQQSDGRWAGTNPTEEPDVVATCWALLALESKLIAPGGKLSVKVDSPADLHLYDPLNRHVGINYETGKVELQIPGANYSGPETEPQIIEVFDPTAGDYRIRLVGREEGAFILIIEGMVDNETIYSKAFEGHISIGEEKELSAVLPAIA